MSYLCNKAIFGSETTGSRDTLYLLRRSSRRRAGSCHLVKQDGFEFGTETLASRPWRPSSSGLVQMIEYPLLGGGDFGESRRRETEALTGQEFGRRRISSGLRRPRLRYGFEHARGQRPDQLHPKNGSSSAINCVTRSSPSYCAEGGCHPYGGARSSSTPCRLNYLPGRAMTDCRF